MIHNPASGCGNCTGNYCKNNLIYRRIKADPNKNTLKGSDTIISTRISAILICGIIVLLAACMNYRETAGLSFEAALMLLSSVLIFAAAGVLYRNEQQ
jgi:nitrate reductase gamma subunit